MESPATKTSAPTGFKLFWALSGLSALGIAQPLLDLLGKNPQFLTVHQFSPLDLVLLLVLLTLVPALILSLLTWFSGLFNQSLGKFMALISGTLLLTILFAPPIKDLLPLPGLILVLISLTLALIVSWKIGGNPKLMNFWGLLGLIPLLVAGLFFFQPGPYSVAFPQKANSTFGGQQIEPPNSETPVVLVVFDAFPTTSIMNLDQGIDESLCPNLFSLNKDAIWYKNALSISDDTLVAVPAILTGQFPLPNQKPNLESHPNNIFSWLQPWRTIISLESHTQLNPSTKKPSFSQRWNLTLSDLYIIFLHSVLPEDFSANLPSITHDWFDFAGHNAPKSGNHYTPPRMKLLKRFLSTISSGEKTACYFLHILVPHTPYQFLPSGRHYTNKGKEPSGEGMQFCKWSQDLQVVLHSQQRMLNQVGYADFLVGKIVGQLKETGVYEDAMIIFAADHGMSFTPGDDRRKLSTTNRGEILPIPLFIKYPGTGKGAIDDRVVQSIDILPTIAAVLGSPLPYAFDGHSLLDSTYSGHLQTQYLGAASQQESLEFDSEEILAQRAASISTKYERFPKINNRIILSAPSRGAELIGTQVPLAIPNWDQWSISLGGDSSRTFSPSLDAIIPAEVQGLISGNPRLPEDWDIAVLVDRQIAAITRPFYGTDSSETQVWSTLLPDEFMVEGKHQVEIVLVQWSENSPKFFAPGQKEISIIGQNLILDTIFVNKAKGVYKLALWGTKPAIWTKGAARYSVSIPNSDFPTAMKLSAEAADPKGAILMVFANGSFLGVERIKKFPWSGNFDLTGIDLAGHLNLDIYSSTHIPAESNPKKSDHRTLGLALSLIELQGGDPGTAETKPNPKTAPFHQVLTPGQQGDFRWSNLHNTEKWKEGPATWTKGQASCQVSWQRPLPPGYLLIEIVGTAPEGSSLSITVNETEVASVQKIQKNWTQLIDLAKVPAATQLEIQVNSSTFTPAQNQKDSKESRVLGVAIRQVMLVESLQPNRPLQK